MEKGRKLFSRIRKEKNMSKDLESNYTDDSFYSFIKEDVETNNNQGLYPIKELEGINDNIDDQFLIDSLDKTKGGNKTYKNTENYLLNNGQVCHYIFDKRQKTDYTKQQLNFRDNVIFNTSHERFGNDIYDPWLFTSLENVKWPSFVKKLYYTKLTPNGSLVMLSYTSNLYLNKLFISQKYAPVLRLFHHLIYELASKLMREPRFEDIKREYVNEKFIMETGNIELIEESGKITRDFNNIDFKHLIVYDIKDKQPTEIAFTSFYDYIPICFNPPQRKQNGEVFFEDPKNLIFSNICFHKDNCHDNWCETHNKHCISNAYKHEHYINQPLFKLEEQKTLDFYQYINNNA